uniref:(northern house mosquito) hypothetical protein n=1 Tax=Culex pipiens TaxID=7175 RepID=A0A8D8G6L1_CULPI
MAFDSQFVATLSRTGQYSTHPHTNKQTQNSGHSSTGKLKLKLGGGHRTQYGTHTHTYNHRVTPFWHPSPQLAAWDGSKLLRCRFTDQPMVVMFWTSGSKQVRAIIARIDAIYDANWRQDGNNVTSRFHIFVMRNLFV